MKRRLLSGLVVAALTAMVGVSAVSAKPGARATGRCSTWRCQNERLSVMPLPASVIGSAAASLPLQHESGYMDDSGNLVDKVSPESGMTVAPNRWYIPVGPGVDQLGWLSGYVLDY